MGDTSANGSPWFDWLDQDPSLVPESVEDLRIDALRVMQVNGRCLYLKATSDPAQLTAAEMRILDTLSHQGDTVVIAVGPDPEHIRMSYRMPDLENAVAFDRDSLRGLIRGWFVWASTQAAAA